LTRIEQIACSLRTARRITLGLVEDVPRPRWTWQPVPGANHVAWTLVHLVVADDWGPASLGDPERRFAHYERFLEGGPQDDPARYPDPDELLQALGQAHERLLGRLGTLQEADLDRPLTGPLSRYAPDVGTVLHSHIWHEGFHAGQIAVIRKALGLPPRFG
jgi:hypothetical protein